MKFILPFYLLLIQRTIAELYSSMAGLEKLLETEIELERILNKYIESETRRLDKLKNLVNREKSVMPGFGTFENSFNPVNAYLFVKSIIDSDSISSLMEQTPAKELLKDIGTKYPLPDESDLNGAVTAITRLQDTYNLKAEDIANGKLLEFPRIKPFSADDCFTIGYATFSNKDYYHALPWMLETESRMNDQNTSFIRSFENAMVYDYLAYSMHDRGNPERAVWYSRMLNAADSSHPSANHLEIYEQILVDEKREWDGIKETLPPLINQRNLDGVYVDYEALCRGEDYMSERERKLLHCYYKCDKPFLKLAPVKVEKIYNKPEVYIFRQIVSDSEIELLKALAKPQLQRAMVVNDNHTKFGDADNIAASFRIAQNAWFRGNDHEVIARLDQRTKDFTNLDLESAEGLQMANYGLGGHYEPHFDMTTDLEETVVNNRENGNRLATVLFYLSQPEAGGATVFEILNVAVFPSKNDALFWHNLHKSGRPDLTTRHAGCPVLYGEKWVANKWIHEIGQDFLRPCTLNENE